MTAHAPTLGDAAVDRSLCTSCGIPLDAQEFDSANVVELPGRGRLVVLATFQLPPKYCGVLRFFSQFTDQQARNAAAVRTTGLRWLLSANGRPLHPYTNLELILNPWGYGSFRVCIRLDENARVEFAVRNVSYDPPASDAITLVGGRITGHYWYNARYGDTVRFAR